MRNTMNTRGALGTPVSAPSHTGAHDAPAQRPWRARREREPTSSVGSLPPPRTGALTVGQEEPESREDGPQTSSEWASSSLRQ